MALPLSVLIQVNTRIAAGGVVGLPFGRGLLVTVDDRLAGGGNNKVKLFADSAGVVSAIGSGDAATAAAVWFSADPRPQGLYIGRWATVDVDTRIVGSDSVGTVTQLAVANATFRFGANDVTVDISGALTYAAVASAIETEIQTLTGYASATFDYETDHFVLELDDAEDLDGPLQPISTGAGTDISTLLGMSGAAGGEHLQGQTAETIEEGVTAMLEQITGGAPVAVMLADDAPLTVSSADTRTNLAAFAQSNDMVFGLRETADQALVANDASSHAAVAFGNNQDKVAAVYTRGDEQPEIALLATMSAQNLGQPASIITPHAKGLPGAGPSVVSQSQQEELARKRTNVYTTVGTLPSLLEGFTSRPGYWLDAVWWLLWMKNELELNIWNAMRASRRLNTPILKDAIEKVMQSGVRNGGIQPGRTVSPSLKDDIRVTTGNLNFDGVLTSGYLVHITPIDERTEVDIESRIGRVKIWAVGSEAIHRVQADLVFQN